MPLLKAYTDGSSKSGHYILANVGGAHPITLQVTEIGEQILEKAGYGDGDNVPTTVVWSMFDVGILYTSGTINDPPEVGDSPDETFEQLGVANKLTPGEQEQLITYLDEYTGPNQAEIDTLRESLEGSSTEEESAMPEDAVDDLDRLSTLHERGELTTEEYELLKSRILDDLPTETASSTKTEDTGETRFDVDEVPFDLAEELWDIVPESKYDNSFSHVQLKDHMIDTSWSVYVNYSAETGGFKYHCYFSEPAHEEAAFELLENAEWTLKEDNSDDTSMPFVIIERRSVGRSFQDDLPDGYVDEEVQYLLEAISQIYGTKPKDLVLE